MTFIKILKYFPWLMLAPWFLYFLAAVFGVLTFWGEEKVQRFTICIAFIISATIILGIMVYPSSVNALAKLIRVEYYFPKEGG